MQDHATSVVLIALSKAPRRRVHYITLSSVQEGGIPIPLNQPRAVGFQLEYLVSCRACPYSPITALTIR